MRAVLISALLLLFEITLGLPEANAPLDLLRSDAEGVTFAFSLPVYQVEQSIVGRDEYQILSVPGWPLLAENGKPQLPVYSVFLGIPPEAELVLDVSEVDQAVLSGYNIRPAPRYDLEPDSSNLVPNSLDLVAGSPAPIFAKDAELYSRNAFFPEQSVVIASSGYIRHQRFVRLELHPFQFNPATGQLRVIRQIEVAVRFRHPGGQLAAPLTAVSDVAEPAGFEEMLKDLLLNYTSARSWRVVAPPESSPAGETMLDLPPYKVLVDQDGIYQLTYDDLGTAGIPVDSLDPRTLQLFNQENEVAIQVFGESDGSFDPQDYVLFYGQSINTEYTDVNVYWLAYGETVGKRMIGRNGTPSGGPMPDSFWRIAHIEQDLYFQSLLPMGNGDHWFWDYLYPPSIPSRTYNYALSNLAGGSYDATLQLNMHGGAEVTHHVEVYVNGNAVGEYWWDGLAPITPTMAFNPEYLQEGTNSIQLVHPNDTGSPADVVYVNWLEVGYRDTYRADDVPFDIGVDLDGDWRFLVSGLSTPLVSVYDITDSTSPVQIQNAVVTPVGSEYELQFQDVGGPQTGYLIWSTVDWLQATILQDTPSNWQSSTVGADHIIITPHEFYSDVVPLAQYRQQQGLRVQVVDLQDVYDEFNFGIDSVPAIRDFIQYAYDDWVPPAPSYVLLVGDGHYDYKDLRDTGAPNPFPPYLAYVDPWYGLAAADNRYVMVSGDDIIPDLYIGRLPGNNSAEIQAMVSKTIAYESAPPAAWHGSVVLYADNPDDAGNFVLSSDTLVDEYLPVPYRADKIYLGSTCPYQNPAVSCKDRLFESINVSGTLFVNYIGHASAVYWGSERLLGVVDLPLFDNPSQLPIHLPMTCNDGRFILPNINTLSESFVRAEGKGAVASWAPSGLGLASGHDRLDQGFFSAVFHQGVRTMGEATLVGKLTLFASGSNFDLIDTYHIFGDPALHINALDLDLQLDKAVEPAGPVGPGDVLTYTLTFTNAGPAMSFGTLLTDALPAGLVSPTVVYSSPEVLAVSEGPTFTWTLTDLLPGASGQVQVRATVDPVPPAPFLLHNQAGITSNIPDTDPANDKAAVSTAIVLPDLEIEKSVQAPPTLRPGDALTYTLAFTNTGQGTAYVVVLTDLLPVELLSPTVVYSSPEVLSQVPGVTYAWHVADLAPGTAGQIQVRSVVSPTAEPPLVIVNKAQILARTPDVDLANNVAWASTGVRLPDVWVSQQAPAGVTFGQTLTYTISWGNDGDYAAPGVWLTDTLPAGIQYVDDDSGWLRQQPAPGVVAWRVSPHPLPAGVEGSFVLTAWVPVDPALNGPLVNRVEIGTSLQDGDPFDNWNEAATTLLLPDLSVSKTGPVEVRPNSILTYTLTYSNVGPGLARNVRITDHMPPGVTYLHDNAGLLPVRPSPGDRAWYVGDLPPGARYSFHLMVQVGDLEATGPVLTNTVEISGTVLDAEPGNQQAQWLTGVTPDTEALYLPLVLRVGP